MLLTLGAATLIYLRLTRRMGPMREDTTSAL
jgi:hypothetical protein